MSEALAVELAPAPKPATVTSLRHSSWSWLAIVGGLIALVLFTSLGLVTFVIHDRTLLRVISIAVMVLLELFLCLYPFWSRRESGIALPSAPRLVIEAAWAVPLVFACLTGAALFGNVVARLFPGMKLTPSRMDEMTNASPSFALYAFMLTGVLIAPLAEEIFFRGFLFNALRQKMPLVWAMVLQAAIFGVVHMYEPVPAIAASLLGVGLALIYWWRQTLWTPIFVHAGYNGIVMLVLLAVMQANAKAPVLGVVSERESTTCLVGSVVPGSPADEAGIKAGDFILKLDNISVQDFPEVVERVRRRQPGHKVVVTVERGGEQHDFTVILKSRKDVLVPPITPEK